MKYFGRACLLLAFLAAVAVRLGFNDDLRGMDLSCGNYDGMDYHWLAKNLCRGRGYLTFDGTGHASRLLRPPGYPLFIAAVYCVAGMNFFNLRIADTLLSALTAVMVALIARELAGRKAALIALLIAVFYRPAAFFATRIFSENLFSFLMLLSVLLMIRTRNARWTYAVAGVLSGLLALTRPVWLGVIPFVLAWLAAPRGGRLARTAGFLAGVAVALAPWALYSRAALGVPLSPAVFSSLRGIYNTWAAHNPAAGDFTQLGAEPGRELEREWTQFTLLRFRGWRMPEREYLAAVSAEAARFFRDNPRRCIALGARRVYRAWLGSGILDGQGTVLPDTGRNPYGVIYWKRRFLDPSVYLGDEEIIEQLPFRRALRLLGVHVPLLSFEGAFYLMVFGLVGCAVRNARHPARPAAEAMRGWSLLWAIALGYSFANIFSVTIQRFRFPLEYLVIIAAGAGIACALSPLFCFIGAGLRALGIRIPAGAEAASPCAGRRVPRLVVWFAALAVAAILAASSVFHLRSFRASLATRCAAHASDADILYRMGGNPAESRGTVAYRGAWERQMEGAGDLGSMLGRTILWRGEATWINRPSRADFRGEYYLAQAQARFSQGMENPGFFRLIVDSYRDPASIGSGEAIVVAPDKMLERLREGDSVAVLGRLGGTDFVVGSMIVCAGDILVLGRDAAETATRTGS